MRGGEKEGKRKTELPSPSTIPLLFTKAEEKRGEEKKKRKKASFLLSVFPRQEEQRGRKGGGKESILFHTHRYFARGKNEEGEGKERSFPLSFDSTPGQATSAEGERKKKNSRFLRSDTPRSQRKEKERIIYITPLLKNFRREEN